jgi:hypothetical protein
MNTKSLITYIVTALFLFIGTTEAQNIFVSSSTTSSAVQSNKLYRNDNTITIYGKVYWHYVRIGSAYYNCGDREAIIEAIKAVNNRVKIMNERAIKYNELKIGRNKVSKNPKDEKDLVLAEIVDVSKYISAVKPALLKDPVKPKQSKSMVGSSLRQPPRKLRP